MSNAEKSPKIDNRLLGVLICCKQSMLMEEIMALSFEDILQNYVNKSYDELKAMARYEANIVLPALRRSFGKEYAYAALLSVISSCIAADGRFSAKEQQFLYELLNLTPDRARAYVEKTANAGFADEFFDSCSKDEKTHLLKLCICFCAVDERISSDEINLLRRLVE